MNYVAVFAGIIPLLVFVIVDMFSGLKTALITAVVLALAEGGLSFYLLGEIDWITGCSVGLIVVLAAISYYTKSSLQFKLQPVILSALFGLFFLVTFFLGKPILLELMLKYRDALPLEVQTALHFSPFLHLLKLSSCYMGWAFLAHAILTLWAALKLNNWWWIAMRGIGFYAFMFAAIIIAKIQVGL